MDDERNPSSPPLQPANPLVARTRPCNYNDLASLPCLNLPHSSGRNMQELHHECGVAAIYHLESATVSPLAPKEGPENASRLMPRMLIDLQNRGQLAAGMTTFNPKRESVLDTYK